MTDSYNQSSINFASKENAGISIYISSLSDLNDIAPADSNGVRTIDEKDVCVIVDTAIDLPPGERIVVGSTTALRGTDPDISGFRGDVNAPLISGQGDGLVVAGLFLRNKNTGNDSFCCLVTNGANLSGRPSRIDHVSVGGQNGIDVFDAASVYISILNRSSDIGVRLRGRTIGVQIVGSVNSGENSTARSLVFDGGVHSGVVIDGVEFAVPSAGAGIEAINLPAVSLFRLSNSNFFPAPGGTPPSSFINGQIVPGVDLGPDTRPDVLFFSNFGVPESSFSGGMVINDNSIPTDTTTLGFGVFVPPGWNAPGHDIFVADNPTSRFEVTNAGGPTELQRLRYSGPEPVSVRITADVTLETAVVFQKRVAVRIVYFPNGLPAPVAGPAAPAVGIPQTAFSGLLADGFFGGGSVGFVQATSRLTLSPGDEIAVEFTDQGTIPGPVNLICQACNISFDQV